MATPQWITNNTGSLQGGQDVDATVVDKHLDWVDLLVLSLLMMEDLEVDITLEELKEALDGGKSSDEDETLEQRLRQQRVVSDSALTDIIIMNYF
ncbi:hypothetical protein NDU88_003625 [Pleurodeles waltl]|uniref:Uncharacterized protein n=1 Tax=Pleurodeles waltl TaxID=8319 RepID=A0AAV7M6T7_PLEWA|nr:hypothetical protein NDU88_003625 [Pleurodeles waltl]